MLDAEGYEQVYGTESIGPNGKVGVKVLVYQPGALANELVSVIGPHVRQIAEGIEALRVKTDPTFPVHKGRVVAELLACFPTGLLIHSREIPNEYCSQPCCYHLPWLRVTTIKGVFKLGWRKRVINLDWSESDVEVESYSLFPGEDVTMGSSYIHAWGYEALTRYLAVLHNADAAL